MTSPTKKHITILFSAGRKARLDDIQRGKSPSDFFYGALELERRGHRVSMVEDADIPTRQTPFVLKKFFVVLTKFTKMPVLMIRRMMDVKFLSMLNASDVILATTNLYGLAMGYLVRKKKVTVPVVFLSMGSVDVRAGRLYVWLCKKLFADMHLATLSKDETAFLTKAFPSLHHPVEYVAFGIDHAFWTPGESSHAPDTPYVITVGNDRHRDYEMLVKAWKPSYPLLKIITRRDIAAAIPENVEIVRGDWRTHVLTDVDLREMVRQAQFVVIPIKQTIQPSGQSFCLQAMACNKAVVLADIKGLWDRDVMRHEDNCLLYLPGDINAFQTQVESLLAGQQQRAIIGENANRSVTEHFTVAHVADGLEKIFNAL